MRIIGSQLKTSGSINIYFAKDWNSPANIAQSYIEGVAVAHSFPWKPKLNRNNPILSYGWHVLYSKLAERMRTKFKIFPKEWEKDSPLELGHLRGLRAQFDWKKMSRKYILRCVLFAFVLVGD